MHPDADLFAVEIPVEYVPEGVFSSPDFVVGRKTCTTVPMNSMVRTERLDVDGHCDE